MKPVLIIIIVVVALLGLGAYKLVGAVQQAGKRGDAAVAAFHRDYNAKDIAAIHGGTTPAFRAATPLLVFSAFTENLHQKLGEWKEGTRTGINVKNQNGDKTLELSYSATFANGGGTEEFVFDYNGAQPALQSYNVKSPLLIDAGARQTLEK